MPRKTKIKKRERVVLTFEDESQIRETPFTNKTYDFVEKMIENILYKKGVKTDCVYVGSLNKVDLYMFISGLIEIYHYSNIQIFDDTDLYDCDDDFDLPEDNH
jgi:hypothetical protein